MAALVCSPAVEKFSTAPPSLYRQDANHHPSLPDPKRPCSISRPRNVCSKIPKSTALDTPAPAPPGNQVSVAEQVALDMGIPALIVQMARSFHMLQHRKDFADARQLYEAAEDLLSNPEKKARVGMKLREAEQEDAGRAQKDAGRRPLGGSDWSAGKMQADKASVTGEGSVGDASAGMRSASLADPAKPAAAAAAVGKTDKAAADRSPGDLAPAALTLKVEPAARDGGVTARLKERVQGLARDNHRLRRRKTCHGCWQVDLADSGVTFLPCGHFITCETCSERYDDCPACGKNIMGTVRTFLS